MMSSQVILEMFNVRAVWTRRNQKHLLRDCLVLKGSKSEVMASEI